jgi:hypothetical protein
MLSIFERAIDPDLSDQSIPVEVTEFLGDRIGSRL